MNPLGNSKIARLTAEKLALEALSLSHARAADAMRRILVAEVKELRKENAELEYKMRALVEF